MTKHSIEDPGEVPFQLTQLPIDDIHIVDNLSRGNIEHTDEEVCNLADEILVNRFWDPPHVTKKRRNRYELADGHMRIAAARILIEENKLPKFAGDSTKGVWVMVSERSAADRDALNAATTIIKKTQSSYERAHTLYELHKRHGKTNKELAEAFKFDPKSVANYIRAARDLIPQIQLAWMNFERTEHIIPLSHLLTWASLEPDDQLREFTASKWSKVYRLADNIIAKQKAGRTDIRARETIELALSESSNITVTETLEWVLRKRKDIDGKQYPDRNNRRERKQSASGITADGIERTNNGGNGATDKNGSGVWPHESGNVDSAPDAAKRGSNGKSRTNSLRAKALNARDMARYDAKPKREN